MKVLLSPAKTLDFNRQINSISHSTPCFEMKANALVDKMKHFNQEELRGVMTMSEQLAELCYQRFQNWENDDLEQKQAGAAFKGEAYNGLDMPSLDEKDLDYAQDHLRILSGIYGILRPFDIIKPYRLEMGSKIKPSLYDTWREELTTFVNNEEQEYIVNLASLEYFKVLDKKKLKAEIIDIEFKEWKNDKLKTIVVYTKKARGMMARYIIQNQISTIEALKQFNTDGYGFNEELSSKQHLVFVR